MYEAILLANVKKTLHMLQHRSYKRKKTSSDKMTEKQKKKVHIIKIRFTETVLQEESCSPNKSCNESLNSHSATIDSR